ncbi:MAG: hypothetical protein EXR92_02920 [Gemmatimonadetes bacterium]|nr:hypothetical protein [Gemmatimonadota bacterium]
MISRARLPSSMEGSIITCGSSSTEETSRSSRPFSARTIREVQAVRFTRIQIARFGPLSGVDTGGDRSLPGLVVVHGPNEAGKSAFHRVVSALIYGLYPASRDKNPFTPWSGGDIEIRGNGVLASGEEWAIHRRLAGTPRGELVRGSAVEELGNRTLPFAAHVDLKLYEGVYGVTLGDMTGLAGSAWDAVRDQLVIGMGSRDLRAPRAVIAELRATANRLWRPNERGSSRHRALRDTLRELRERRQEAEAGDRELRDLTNEISRVERHLKTLRERRASAAEGLERLRELVPLRRRVDRLDELERRVGDPESLRGLPRDLMDRIPALTQAVSRSGDRLREVETERVGALAAEKRRIEDLHRELQALEAGRAHPPTGVRKWPLPLLVAGLMGLVAAWLRTDVLFLAGAPILSAILRAVPIAAIALGIWAAAQDRMRLADAAERARKWEAREQVLRDRVAESEASRSVSMRSLEEAFAPRLTGARELYEEDHRRLAEIESALRRAGGGSTSEGLERVEARLKDLEHLERLREELERDAGSLRELKERIDAAERTTEGWMRASDLLVRELPRLAKLDREVEETARQETRLRERIEQASREETVDLVEGRILDVEERMSEVEKERDRSFVLARLLEWAEDRFRSQHQPDLLLRAAGYLSSITAGRYGSILAGVGDGQRDLSLEAGHLPHPTPVADPLSTGLREQVYLAFRLAIVDHLDQGREPLPLLLDEVLVNWDPERRSRALRLLVEVSRTRQVFVFTCDPHIAAEVAAIGGREIPLPSPDGSKWVGPGG